MRLDRSAIQLVQQWYTRSTYLPEGVRYSADNRAIRRGFVLAAGLPLERHEETAQYEQPRDRHHRDEKLG